MYQPGGRIPQNCALALHKIAIALIARRTSTGKSASGYGRPVASCAGIPVQPAAAAAKRSPALLDTPSIIEVVAKCAAGVGAPATRKDPQNDDKLC